jgi:DNA-binding MarR family transcriptional regulator
LTIGWKNNIVYAVNYLLSQYYVLISRMSQKTDDNRINSIVEDISRMITVVHRSLLSEFASKGLSRNHVMIMKVLSKSGAIPTSTIAKELLISKSQMTHLIDKLIEMGMVERQPNQDDRRVINIALTSKGKTVVVECETLIKNKSRARLAYLSNKEIEELSVMLKKLVEIESRQG